MDSIGIPAAQTFNAGPWTLDDGIDDAAADTMVAWLADPVLARAMGRNVTQSSRAHVIRMRASLAGNGWLLFLRRRDDRAAVGHVLIAVEPRNGVARFDVLIANRQVNPAGALDEIVTALGSWVFEKQRIRKIAVHARADNAPLRRWLDGIMVQEGVLRSEIIDGSGRAVDQVVYGTLAHEWREVLERIAARPHPHLRAERKQRLENGRGREQAK